MSLLLPAQPIVDRLSQTCKPDVREIGTAADLAAAGMPGPGAVAAFVVPGAAEPFENREGSGPLRQTFRVVFTVLLRINVSGLRGEAGLKKLEIPAGKIRTSLFGWRHPAAELKCESAGEGLEDFDPKTSLTLYRLDFATQVRLVENPS